MRLRRAIFALTLVGLLSLVYVAAVALRAASAEPVTRLTYYTPSICWDAACTTASGWSAYSIAGAAACGPGYPMWTRFRFVGTTWEGVCIDLGHPAYFHGYEIDLFVRNDNDGLYLMALLSGRDIEIIDE